MLKSSLKSYHVHRERAISTDGYVSPTPYLADHRWRCHVKDGVVSLPLSPVETQLCDLLKSFAQTVGTTPRLAGGFVRDKLIGKETHDIDVTLDTMTGAHFIDLFSDWLKTKDVTCSSVGVISRNPEQSKHLETATARILGLDIDFCNLRSERYAEGSRIPTVEMGTLQQDADRRDFCCNAMFYNVATGLMEDLTGRGLHDCTCGIIRTPLDPVITFLDDPLRILR
ncbi:MAG: uncharacterized protein KVP18_004722 [Porospora cf. gigantea A]|nr:MAG: hypothetical protein KVP18_004722 [Porospora cf. gigantea A]